MKDKGLPECDNPAVQEIPGQPDSAWELVNKYGTYEIQPTSDTENKYPSIHQGLPQQWKNLRESKQELFEDKRERLENESGR